METDYNNNENINRITLDDKEIILVGTAHISKESVKLVEQAIEIEAPDTVAIELCEPRYNSLKDVNRWKNLDLFAVIKQGKAYVLMSQLVLAGFQKKIARELDITPGAEMMAAIKAANEKDLEIVLADREVKTTLKRTWANLTLWQVVKVVFGMVFGLFSNEKISEEEIERLKSTDALEELLRDFTATLPQVRESLIDERDIYLSQKIRKAPGKKVVAVVGAGHTPGIKEHIRSDIDLAPLETIPKPGPWRRALPWLIPAIVIGLVIFGFTRVDFSTGVDMIYYWFVVNAVLAGIGAALVLPHPLTVLAAAIASPFTSLNPFIAAGWVAGLTEALIRKPKVKDLESIADDISSFKSAISNQAVKILLVIASTNLFGMIGTFIGLERIVSLLR